MLTSPRRQAPRARSVCGASPGSTAAPQWSLAGLRALVGYAYIEAPVALAALHQGRSGPSQACELLFASVAAALESPAWRRALDGLLAALLAEEAAVFTHRSLYELAALRVASDGLSRHSRLAILWVLGRHPCSAARRIEERFARDLTSGSKTAEHPLAGWSVPSDPSPPEQRPRADRPLGDLRRVRRARRVQIVF